MARTYYTLAAWHMRAKRKPLDPSFFPASLAIICPLSAAYYYSSLHTRLFILSACMYIYCRPANCCLQTHNLYPTPGYVCTPSPQLSVICNCKLCKPWAPPTLCRTSVVASSKKAHMPQTLNMHMHKSVLYLYTAILIYVRRFCLALTCEVESGLSHQASGPAACAHCKHTGPSRMHTHKTHTHKSCACAANIQMCVTQLALNANHAIWACGMLSHPWGGNPRDEAALGARTHKSKPKNYHSKHGNLALS